VAGLDEVGVGALAGPVVAAAVLLPLEARVRGLKDSKLLTPEKREVVYADLLKRRVPCAIGMAYAQEIDRYNIFHAARLAMQRATDLLYPRPQHLLMDGHLPPNFGLPTTAIVHGDRLCPVISAASVVAKVYRDRLMRRLALLYPQYHFENNKGYGTSNHYEALRQYGPCPIHRRHYAPVVRNGQLPLSLEEIEAEEELLEEEVLEEALEELGEE
jgi:ribonuclease HII